MRQVVAAAVMSRMGAPRPVEAGRTVSEHGPRKARRWAVVSAAVASALGKAAHTGG
jgi:hypothetical protein